MLTFLDVQVPDGNVLQSPQSTIMDKNTSPPVQALTILSEDQRFTSNQHDLVYPADLDQPTFAERSWTSAKSPVKLLPRASFSSEPHTNRNSGLLMHTYRPSRDAPQKFKSTSCISKKGGISSKALARKPKGRSASQRTKKSLDPLATVKGVPADLCIAFALSPVLDTNAKQDEEVAKRSEKTCLACRMRKRKVRSFTSLLRHVSPLILTEVAMQWLLPML